MALKKKINRFGYDFEYSMISILGYSKELNKTHITVSLYKDKATRDEDITNFGHSMDFTADGNKTVSECYDFLKTTEQYQDAEDC